MSLQSRGQLFLSGLHLVSLTPGSVRLQSLIASATRKASCVSCEVSHPWFPTLCAVLVKRRVVSCHFSRLVDFLASPPSNFHLPPVFHLRLATCGCVSWLHPESAQSLTCLIYCKNAIMFPASGRVRACVQSTGIISSVSLLQGSCGYRCNLPPPAWMWRGWIMFQYKHSGCLEKRNTNPSCYYYYCQHSERKKKTKLWNQFMCRASVAPLYFNTNGFQVQRQMVIECNSGCTNRAPLVAVCGASWESESNPANPCRNHHLPHSPLGGALLSWHYFGILHFPLSLICTFQSNAYIHACTEQILFCSNSNSSVHVAYTAHTVI